MAFAVVEFWKGSSVGIARSSWISGTGESLSCLWPIRRLRLAVLEDHIPDKHTWRKHRLRRIFKTCDTYEQATRIEEEALYSSNVETDNGSDKEENRTQKRARPTEDSDRSDTDAEDMIQKPAERPPAKMPQPPSIFANSQMQDRPRLRAPQVPRVLYGNSKDDNTTAIQEEESSTPASPVHNNTASDTQFIPSLTSTPTTSVATIPEGTLTETLTAACKCKVQQSLQDMAEQNRKIIANQVIIIDLLQQQQQSDQQLQATRVEETILFKATNLQELDQLDVSLNSEGSKTAAYKHLYALGGSNVKETLSRIMDRIATNDVWARFSQKGKAGKLSLIDTKPHLYDTIKRTCHKKHTCGHDAFATAMQNLLKSAPIKKGGPKFSSKRKSTSSASIDCVADFAPDLADPQ